MADFYLVPQGTVYVIRHQIGRAQKIMCIRVLATVGGAGRGRPPLTISAQHPKKN